MGLREQKKKKTRKAISDLATALFLERGYNNVTTAEIAELSEVSVPTLFKYFPNKESLVFDEEDEVEEWLITTVTKREDGQSILDALLQAGIKKIDEIPSDHKNNAKKFMELIENTPELSQYAKLMWSKHEIALSQTIKKEASTKTSKLESECIARFVLDSFYRSIKATNSKAALKSMFNLLKTGWDF